MVGIGMNNVDRFGPSGSKETNRAGAQIGGGSWRCIDLTPAAPNDKAIDGEFLKRGYPTPNYNLFSFYSYDGLPLIVHDRFVNFLKDQSTLLTTADKAVVNDLFVRKRLQAL